MIEGRTWTFTVSAPTLNKEVVCIVGSCDELGNWDPCRIIPLQQQPGGRASGAVYTWGAEGRTAPCGADATQQPEPVLWSVTLQLPLEQIGYRYCIAELATGQCPSVYAIWRWETHFRPRSVPATITQDPDGAVSQFGHSWGKRRVEAGWLVHDSAVQFKLCLSKNHDVPITLWKKKYKGRKLRVKVTALDLGTDSFLVEDTTEHSSCRHPAQSVSWPVMEVAVLKEGECSFRSQSQFGIVFDEEYFTVFQCRLLDHNSVAYMFDYYLEGTPGEIPLFIGCSNLLPSNLVENFGVATIPITSPRHLPIGQLTVHYMVVKPMPRGASDMSVSYTRYWKESWKGLEIGHRGAGNSYHSQPKSCSTIRENTVASFKYAADQGADMVEIDVQLSRDFVPVIYHDFHACIALKRKKDQQHSDLLEIPIKDLTIEQLHALKVYHKKENGLNKFSDEEFEDHQPFPTLECSLRTVPHTCGFNIEIKWTMQLKDGTYELMHPFELNNFMDIILKVVLEHGGQRKIVFSCFHPDICTMLRLKQNRYPVLFLTQGMSESFPAYNDVRCQSIRQAVLYATTADILGINLYTEDLLRDASQMDLALKNNLIVFCWGDLNNDKQTISFLKKLGMHAIIYDKIDVYNSKTEKESIFLCEERQQEQQKQDECKLETAARQRITSTEMGSGCSVTELGSGCSVDRTNMSEMLAIAINN